MAEDPPWLKATKQRTGTATAPAQPPKQKWSKRDQQKHGGAASAGVTVMLPAVDVEPTTHDKLRLEEFARQYIIDFNQTRAAARMGYAEGSAAQAGNQMFWKPYTQAYLVALIRGIEERTIVGRNEVLAGLLREANNFGMDADSSSRIKAWTEIGKILGMYVARVEIAANSSGVMEVPISRNVNEWEVLASGSQAMLMEAART